MQVYVQLSKIPGFPGYSITKSGDIYSHVSNKFLIQCLSNRGYHKVYLYKNKTRTEMLVHVLVLRTFVGKKHKGIVGNHKDLNKTNNHVSNLEYVTKSEDVKHAMRNGAISMKGALNPCAIINEKVAHKIKELLRMSGPVEVSKKLNISKYIVRDISAGRTWRHVRV